MNRVPFRYYFASVASLMRWPAAATIALTTFACGSTAPPVPQLIDVQPFDPASSDVCEAACARRREWGCLETALVEGCVPTCRAAAAKGLYNPTCVVQASSREALAECRVRCGR